MIIDKILNFVNIIVINSNNKKTLENLTIKNDNVLEILITEYEGEKYYKL